MPPPASAAGTARTALSATSARSPSHPSVGIRHSNDERTATDVTAPTVTEMQLRRPTNNRRELMPPRSELVPRLEQPAIDVAHLRKTYPGGVEAVKGITFDVPA